VRSLSPCSDCGPWRQSRRRGYRGSRVRGKFAEIWWLEAFLNFSQAVMAAQASVDVWGTGRAHCGAKTVSEKQLQAVCHWLTSRGQPSEDKHGFKVPYDCETFKIDLRASHLSKSKVPSRQKGIIKPETPKHQACKVIKGRSQSTASRLILHARSQHLPLSTLHTSLLFGPASLADCSSQVPAVAAPE
jgi:hypothetical protein